KDAQPANSSTRRRFPHQGWRYGGEAEAASGNGDVDVCQDDGAAWRGRRKYEGKSFLYHSQIPLGYKHSVDGPGLLSSRDQWAERYLVRASRQGISVLRVHRRPSGSQEPTGTPQRPPGDHPLLPSRLD
ncbi:unnamed protein product, partial [Ectocarpus sp. 12 AP-2014]